MHLTAHCSDCVRADMRAKAYKYVERGGIKRSLGFAAARDPQSLRGGGGAPRQGCQLMAVPRLEQDYRRYGRSLQYK